MILAFTYGDVTIRPSNTELLVFLAGVGTLGYGIWNGKWGVASAGGLVMGTVGYRSYEKAKELAHPELMNGHFLTDGKLSATRGEGEAEELRGLLGL